MTATAQRSQVAGLTVIETLIAATLFLTAVVVMIGLYPASARATRQAQGHLLATNLAERELEISRGSHYDALEDRSNTYTLTVENNGAREDITFTTNVTVSDVRPDALKRIHVEVTWQGTDLFNRKIEMETYSAKLTP